MAQRENRDAWPNYPLENGGSGRPSASSQGNVRDQRPPVPVQSRVAQGYPSAQAAYNPAQMPDRQSQPQAQDPGGAYLQNGYGEGGMYQPSAQGQMAAQGSACGAASYYPMQQGNVNAYGQPYAAMGQGQSYRPQPGQAAPSSAPSSAATTQRQPVPQQPLASSQRTMQQQAVYQSSPSPYQGAPYPQGGPYQTPSAPQGGASGTPGVPRGHFAQRPSPYDPKKAGGAVQNPIARSEKQGKGGKAKTVVLCCLGLVLGAAVGIGGTLVFQGGLHSAPVPVAGVLGESQLDTVVGTYRYKGEVYEVTARDAILGSGSLSTARRSDGSYETPSTDEIVSYARNNILAQLVKDNGIEVSADEVAQYAMNLVGSSDADAVAAYFGMEATDAQRLLGEAAAVAKLRQTVVGQPAAEPEPPQPPEDGVTEVGTAAYADYIIGLLGANWDSGAQTWANTANPYYEALKDEVFAPGSASYDSAQLAYSVARQEYENTPSAQQRWAEYLNTYLDEGSISVNTLRA